MSDVVLGRAVAVSMYELVMEVVVEDRRSDLMALLMLADERGGLSASDVNRHMLFRPSGSPHGRMVVRALMDRGLLDRGSPMYRGEDEDVVRHPLSSLGGRALGRRRMLRRRRGVFRTIVTDDPLVPGGVLSIDEVSGPRRGRGARVDTPRQISDSVGRSITLPLNASMEVRVEHAAQMALELAQPPIVNLEVRDDEHGEVVLVKREADWSPVPF